MSESYTEEEVKAYGEEIVRQSSETKNNLHTFLTRVIQDENTTKTGNLSDEELGLSRLPVRSLMELELFCRDICADDGWADYFKKSGEIQKASSLSKDGFLLKLSVTNKKELADVTPERKKKNKGWFRKGDSAES